MIPWPVLFVAVVLCIAYTAYVIEAHRCRAKCAVWNADKIGSWEREHGPIEWANPDAVDPRLIECVCR